MFIIPIVSCFASALAILAMLNMKRALPLDHPNHRSLHERPTPRTGGLAIMMGAAFGWALSWPPYELMPMLALALVLSALTFIDDVRGLPIGLRFGLHFTAAAVFLGTQPILPGHWVGEAIALIAVIWMTNLFNFMDGSDGLAGGMAAIGFGFFYWAAYRDGMIAFALTAASLTGASLGFLLFNFSPARIFMGDTGSIPLGFLAATLGITGWQDRLWPITFPVLIFSPFIADASLSLAKRLLRGEKVWQAHREHYYQRLIRMGLGHKKTALFGYGLMFACGFTALLIQHSSALSQVAMVSAWAIAYGKLFHFIDKEWGERLRKGDPP